MGGRRNRNEFGQALDKTQDKRTDDRLIGHELSIPEALGVKVWDHRRALADSLVFAPASSYSFFKRAVARPNRRDKTILPIELTKPDRMPTLYHHPMSTASRFVRLILVGIRLSDGTGRGAALGEAAGLPDAQSGRHAAGLCRRQHAGAVWRDCDLGISRRDKRRSEARPSASGRRPVPARGNPPADRMVPAEDGSRRNAAAGARAHFQAADDARPGRRRTGFEGPSHVARQYPPAPEISRRGLPARAPISPATGCPMPILLPLRRSPCSITSARSTGPKRRRSRIGTSG